MPDKENKSANIGQPCLSSIRYASVTITSWMCCRQQDPNANKKIVSPPAMSFDPAKRTMTETGLSTGAAGRHLTGDIHEEILLRLPAESVLRCRAVCRAWRRIATDPRFIAAHARRRPAQAVLYTYLDAPPRENRTVDRAGDVALDVTPISGESGSGPRRRLIRYPGFGRARDELSAVGWHLHCLMLGSCDGVLVFKKDLGFYLLCNPVTRQWVQLPRLDELYCTVRDVEYAFYFHQPSGEYRLLCGLRTRSGQTWCVLSTGAAEPRRADTHVQDGMVIPCLRWTESPPAALHDRLHWPPRLDMYFQGETTRMVTFDTMSETFQFMMGPSTTSTLLKLFVMHGLIVVADVGKEKHIDLWFLEDYGAERWERRHQVATPWDSPRSMPHFPSCLLSVAALADDQGNVMLGNHRGLVVYNVRTNTARTVDSVATPTNNVLMSRYVFRESLVQLPRFNLNLPGTADLPLIHFWN